MIKIFHKIYCKNDKNDSLKMNDKDFPQDSMYDENLLKVNDKDFP
jgi:hypothetical protein